MVNGRIIWRKMDIKGLIQGMVIGKMEQQHLGKDMLKTEMDQGLEVNQVEQDLIDIEVSQEKMEIDQDLNQGRKVSWARIQKK